MEQSPEDRKKLDEIKRKARQDRLRQERGGDQEDLGSTDSAKKPSTSDKTAKPSIGGIPLWGMSTGTKILLLVVIPLLAAVVFASYGTISPCGMLEKDMRRMLTEEMSGKRSSGNPWETIGSALGVSMGGAFIENMIASLSPLQCMKGLWRIHVAGEKPFADRLSSSDSYQSPLSSSSSSSYSSPSSTDTDIDELLYPKGWNVRTDRSPMDDSLSVYLSTWADKSIEDWLDNEHRPALYLRCREDKTDGFINLQTNIEYDYRSDTAALRLRYDSESAEQVRFNVSTDREAVFFRTPIPTIKKMLNHDKLLVEVTLDRKGPQLFTFDLTGLDKEITQLRKACHW